MKQLPHDLETLIGKLLIIKKIKMFTNPFLISTSNSNHCQKVAAIKSINNDIKLIEFHLISCNIVQSRIQLKQNV